MGTIYSVWLQQLNLSDYVKKQILLIEKSCQSIYEASYKDYKEWGLSHQAAIVLEESKKELNLSETILKQCNREDVKIVSFWEEAYPWQLREIPDPPCVLYIKGHLEGLMLPMIAIVGARKCSEYGEQIAIWLGKELAALGIGVISGMAMGVDGAAHFGALQTGTTIGILGTGVDICYPSCNYQIYRKIVEKGCLVSEYPLGTKGQPYHFPRRNRIISGMSYGVVVVEAAVRSGSLITAQLALDYDREVYAVPGNINHKLSSGTNTLIKQGAKCISSIEDIVEGLPKGLCIKSEVIKKNRNKLNTELAQEERIVYANVSQEPIMFEKILENTQLSCEKINTSLLQLEVKGLIQRLPGERYVRI